MAEERVLYQNNDVGPFASFIYTLVHGGPGMEQLDLKLGDRDMVLIIEHVRSLGGNENAMGDEDEDAHEESAHILHLKNVREDTIGQAQRAVDNFLNQFEPLGDDNGHHGHTVFQMFDRVHEDMDASVNVAVGSLNDLKLKLIDMDRNGFMYPKKGADKGTESYNPVTEMIAACNSFLVQARAIQERSVKYSDETSPSRDATILAKGLESVHRVLRGYIGDQSTKRGLAFNWNTRSYPPPDRSSGEQPKCHAYFDEDEGWLYEIGQHRVL